MDAEFFKTLKELCELHGPSGDEGTVAAYILERVQPHADEAYIDRAGNVLALKKGLSSGKPLMVCAHMDEVGFIVTGFTPEGCLRTAPVGGFDRRAVLGKAVRVASKSGMLPGMTALVPIHLASDGDKKHPPKDITVDIGAKNRAEVEGLISPGDYISFDTKAEMLGSGMFKAKAIDDRLGCAVMLSLLCDAQLVPARDTWFAFTVCEEVGGRGAAGASFTLDPEAALILEATTAADLPGVSEAKQVCVSGNGAVISYMDRSAIYDRAMFEKLSAYADSAGVKWQTKSLVAGGTDAGTIQKIRAGIPCAGLAAAVRYIHAPASLASLADMDCVLRLARAAVDGSAGTLP